MCNNYLGDSGYHLYIHCMKKGIVTALQCMECEDRKMSEVRSNTKKDFELRRKKANEHN